MPINPFLIDAYHRPIQPERLKGHASWAGLRHGRPVHDDARPLRIFSYQGAFSDLRTSVPIQYTTSCSAIGIVAFSISVFVGLGQAVETAASITPINDMAGRRSAPHRPSDVGHDITSGTEPPKG